MPVFTVRQISEATRNIIQRAWPEVVTIDAEVGQVTLAGSGHAYLTLRDAESVSGRNGAQMDAVCWSSAWRTLAYKPAQGDRVLCRGRLDMYPVNARFQLNISSISRAGDGALAKEIAARKARLEAEGLLDPRRKRPLVAYPRVVGVATSLTGAALQDFLKVSRERNPGVRILVSGCVVQGPNAPASVIQAVELLLEDGRAEVIVVTRGGGGKEDLLAFQDEALARFLAHSLVPVVSAVGHQIDTTLCDFVADKVVATPTEAAIAVLPDASVERQRVDDLALRMITRINHQIERSRGQLQAWSGRLRHPSERIRHMKTQADELERRAIACITRLLADFDQRERRASGALPGLVERLLPPAKQRLVGGTQGLDRAFRVLRERKEASLQRTLARLQALSPLAVLSRGYAVVLSQDGVVTHPAQAASGVALTIRLEQGTIGAVSSGEVL